MSRIHAVPCTLLLAALLACEPAGTATPLPEYPPNAQLDSGNMRFAAGDHDAALAYYRAAAAEDGTNAAAWFGVYMASRALGDSAAAASALAHVHMLVPDSALADHPHPSPAGPSWNPH